MRYLDEVGGQPGRAVAVEEGEGGAERRGRYAQTDGSAHHSAPRVLHRSKDGRKG